MENRELIGLSQAAQIAKVNRRTIQEWEKKGWISVSVQLAPRINGRPGRLYDAEEIRRVARNRGRSVD